MTSSKEKTQIVLQAFPAMMSQLVTAEIGPLSLYASTQVKGVRHLPNLKIHEKKKRKKLQQQFFRTNDQANKENMLSEKKLGG